MLSPTQIQKLISNYAVADYEVRDWACTHRLAWLSDACARSLLLQTPISSEVLKAVASRVMANDRNDHLLLPPESDEVGPFECPLPRNIEDLYTYIPAWCV
jgi:myosin-5